MPHKHKRKRGDDTDFDLPPSQRARPLPTAPKKEDGNKHGNKHGNKRGNKHDNKSDNKNGADAPKKKIKTRKQDNDAPRAFRRLMAAAQGKKFRSGLDDGQKAKPGKGKADETASADMPKIRPGEDMRSFAARVDAAMPVAGLAKKTIVRDGKDEQGLKVYRTKKERKMHKLYDQWREEERKINELKEEEAERQAERELDGDPDGITSKSFTSLDDHEAEKKGRNGKKKGKKDGDDDDDPWAELKKKRSEAKIGLHDVALAPPELHKKQRKQLQVGDATADVGNIPKSAGSLKRREELQQSREDVLEAYRKIREHEQAKLDAQKRK